MGENNIPMAGRALPFSSPVDMITSDREKIGTSARLTTRAIEPCTWNFLPMSLNISSTNGRYRTSWVPPREPAVERSETPFSRTGSGAVLSPLCHVKARSPLPIWTNVGALDGCKVDSRLSTLWTKPSFSPFLLDKLESGNH